MDGRSARLGARAQAQTAGREDRKGRLWQGCARRSREGVRRGEARRRRAGASLGVWPYSAFGALAGKEKEHGSE